MNEYEEENETDPLPVFCENVVVNPILGYYSLKAKENGTPFHCACSIPKRLSMSDSDLCVVLGNTLENAIEACGNLDNPEARFLAAEAGIVKTQHCGKVFTLMAAFPNLCAAEESRSVSRRMQPFAHHNSWILEPVTCFAGSFNTNFGEKGVNFAMSMMQALFYV
ncbi:GHKL domain-containing protein [Desulfosporosinus acidiphilus]|uniref:GHKL domain-containing protein n=1 Tax=Desulfosporosinus acidiphilus TaxID=885581 RepID=UPI001FA703EE|nr:GHKL domain-containing protein [Desulfosporosinus acidiphilus]